MADTVRVEKPQQAKPSLLSRLRGLLRSALQRSIRIILSILASMVVGSLIMLWYKQNPIQVYTWLFQGAFGSERAIFISIQRATPLIFTAIASMLAFRTGVFNVGVEGQFFIGAIAGTYVGYAFRLPAIIHIPLTMIAAFAAGAAWAYIPTIMRQKLGVSEIITTIMTNYIATFLISYLTNYPMRGTPTTPETPFIQDTAKLAQFVELPGGLGRGSQAHVGIFIAVALVIVIWFVLKYTKIGYEWRMAGISSRFSQFAGIDMDRVFILGMLVSGGIAGLGGVVEIAGVWRKYKDLFATGFGFRGNLAALLGRNTVFGSTIAAIFYGSMEAGALGLEWSAGLPRQLIDIAVGLIVFFMAAEGMWDFVVTKKGWSLSQLLRRNSGKPQVHGG